MKDTDLNTIRMIITDNLKGRQATLYIFGSRTKGAEQRASDVDIALDPEHPLPPALLSTMREQLEESTIPFTIDLIDLSQAPAVFAQEIRSSGTQWTL